MPTPRCGCRWPGGLTSITGSAFINQSRIAGPSEHRQVGQLGTHDRSRSAINRSVRFVWVSSARPSGSRGPRSAAVYLRSSRPNTSIRTAGVDRSTTTVRKFGKVHPYGSLLLSAPFVCRVASSHRIASTPLIIIANKVDCLRAGEIVYGWGLVFLVESEGAGGLSFQGLHRWQFAVRRGTF